MRLFDLICLREAELKDLEQNVGAIAAAMAPADAGDATALKAENSRLKGELQRKEQHIEALKGLISTAGSGGDAAAAAAGGASPPRVAAGVVRPAGQAQPMVRQVAPGGTTTTTRYAAGGTTTTTTSYGAAGVARPLAPGAGSPLRPGAPTTTTTVRPAGAPYGAPGTGGYSSGQYYR